METLRRIEGIDGLLQQLPKEYHHWHRFGTILSLNFERFFDYEKKFEDIACMHLVLTDKDCKYKIKMQLTDVTGDMHFHTINGFFSGFVIQDNSEYGWETERCFLLTSFEQDIDFALQCASIAVELLDC